MVLKSRGWSRTYLQIALIMCVHWCHVCGGSDVRPLFPITENGPYELNSKGEVVEREIAWDVTSSECT